MRQVGDEQRIGAPLGEQAGDERSEPEPGGERDRRPPGPRLRPSARIVGRAGELLDPRGAGGERGAAAEARQQPAEVEQPERVVPGDEQDGRDA